MHRVGAVIVDFFAAEDLVNCVDSLRLNDVEHIVVVDNSTENASATTLVGREVILVDTQVNAGYGRGMNRGVAFAGECEYLVLSNPDVVVHPQAVTQLVAYMDTHQAVGIAGPTIVDSQGVTYPSVRQFPNVLLAGLHALLAPLWNGNPFTKRYRSPGRNGQVDWVSGSFFITRASAFQAVGGFDERYFMFAEDMDLCWRLREAGWGVAVVPEATVTHIEGVSRARAPRAMVRAHHASALRFEARTARGARRLLLPLAALVLGIRYLALVSLSPRAPIH
ncbi:MAG: glycosyltransferase family 2 protein [Actinomycetes bacterium]